MPLRRKLLISNIKLFSQSKPVYMKKVHILLVCLLITTCAYPQLFHSVYAVRNSSYFYGPSAHFETINNKLVFYCLNEIGCTDGTDAGSVFLNGTCPSCPDSMGVFPGPSSKWRYRPNNGKICFVAQDGVNAGLGITDGTVAGTSYIGTLAPNASASGLNIIDINVCNGKFYFYGPNEDHSIWTTDGTSAGTQAVFTYPLYGSVWGLSLGVNNNQLYFSGSDNTNGTEPWVSDATETSAHIITDLNPGSDGSQPTTFYTFNGRVYFDGYSTSYNTGLFSTDGTAGGTLPVYNSAGIGFGESGFGTYNFYTNNNTLYFLAHDTSQYNAIWASDGTNAGTKVILSNPNAHVHPTEGVPLSPWADEMFAPLGNKLVFGANGGPEGYEVWITDGTATGTSLLKDINPNGSSWAQIFKYYNGKVYFIATNDTTDNYQLWETDGSAAGTIPVPNAPSALTNALSPCGEMATFDSSLYFTANYDSLGIVLYKFVAPVTQPATGITEIPAADQFWVYPNPAHNQITVRFENQHTSARDLTIYDVLGNAMQKTETTSQQFTMATDKLAPGIYLLKYISENGSLPVVKKFIKE
jgi:ELWxxDGT repeat protein